MQVKALMHTVVTGFVRVTGFVTLAVCSSTMALAERTSVQVTQCWVRAMSPDLSSTLPSAAYFVLKNDGDQPVTLKGVHTPAFGKVEMHQTKNNGTKMVSVDSVEVSSHSTVEFAPGGYHVMLKQQKNALKIGATIPLTLDFDGGTKVVTQCELKSASGK